MAEYILKGVNSEMSEREKHFDLWDEGHVAAILNLSTAQKVHDALACFTDLEDLAAELLGIIELARQNQKFKSDLSSATSSSAPPAS